jgi:hypothetical protein
MSGVPSAGWREVYQACHVDVPMTSQRGPPLRERPQSGTSTTMSDATMSEVVESIERSEMPAPVEEQLCTAMLAVAEAHSAEDVETAEAKVERAMLSLENAQVCLEESKPVRFV